jgi:hypothetical protein
MTNPVIKFAHIYLEKGGAHIGPLFKYPQNIRDPIISQAILKSANSHVNKLWNQKNPELEVQHIIKPHSNIIPAIPNNTDPSIFNHNYNVKLML